MSSRKIDDHSFFAGGKSKDSVFPKGVHTKHESSAGGAGELSHCVESSEDIKKVQEMNKSKANSHKMKDGHRN